MEVSFLKRKLGTFIWQKRCLSQQVLLTISWPTTANTIFDNEFVFAEVSLRDCWTNKVTQDNTCDGVKNVLMLCMCATDFCNCHSSPDLNGDSCPQPPSGSTSVHFSWSTLTFPLLGFIFQVANAMWRRVNNLQRLPFLLHCNRYSIFMPGRPFIIWTVSLLKSCCCWFFDFDEVARRPSVKGGPWNAPTTCANPFW